MEEEFLQVRLLHRQRDDGVARRFLHEGVGAPIQPTVQQRAFNPEVADPGKPDEVLGPDRTLEPDLDFSHRPLTEILDALNGHQPSFANDPNPVCGLLDLAHHV